MKDKIISIAFTLVLIFFLIFGIVLPDKEISVSERRKLQEFPKLEIEEVFSGKFFTKLDDYLVEQFPLREWFRKLKGTISTKVFQKKENNGVFQEGNKIYQLNANVDEKSIEHILSLIAKIKENQPLEEIGYYEDGSIKYEVCFTCKENLGYCLTENKKKINLNKNHIDTLKNASTEFDCNE